MKCPMFDGGPENPGGGGIEVFGTIDEAASDRCCAIPETFALTLPALS